MNESQGFSINNGGRAQIDAWTADRLFKIGEQHATLAALMEASDVRIDKNDERIAVIERIGISAMITRIEAVEKKLARDQEEERDLEKEARDRQREWIGGGIKSLLQSLGGGLAAVLAQHFFHIKF